MQVEAIRKAVLAIIESIAPETNVQRIRPDQPLRQQIELDSADWLNVIVGLHDRLAIDIPESDYSRLTTLDSIITYLVSREAEPPAAPSQAAPPPRAQLPCTRHLVNNATVKVRPIRPDDMPLEADFIRRLSADARYQRFMLTLSELSPAKLHDLTDVDQVRHVALVATVDRNGGQVLVGAVRYIVDPAGTGCEFAVAIDDAWQGFGLAGILMHRLMNIARSRGLATMEGLVLTTNTRMLRFARALGFRLERIADDRETVRIVRSL